FQRCVHSSNVHLSITLLRFITLRLQIKGTAGADGLDDRFVPATDCAATGAPLVFRGAEGPSHCRSIPSRHAPMLAGTQYPERGRHAGVLPPSNDSLTGRRFHRCDVPTSSGNRGSARAGSIAKFGTMAFIHPR